MALSQVQRAHLKKLNALPQVAATRFKRRYESYVGNKNDRPGKRYVAACGHLVGHPNTKACRACHKGGVSMWTRVAICECCGDEIANAAPRQKVCNTCTPSKAWRALYRRYGVGKPQWDKLLKAQGGHCALCDAEPSVVDHDHNTERTRGLLCCSCNLLVAALDRPEWMARAVSYLEKFSAIC